MLKRLSVGGKTENNLILKMYMPNILSKCFHRVFSTFAMTVVCLCCQSHVPYVLLCIVKMKCAFMHNRTNACVLTVVLLYIAMWCCFRGLSRCVEFNCVLHWTCSCYCSSACVCDQRMLLGCFALQVLLLMLGLHQSDDARMQADKEEEACCATEYYT